MVKNQERLRLVKAITMGIQQVKLMDIPLDTMTDMRLERSMGIRQDMLMVREMATIGELQELSDLYDFIATGNGGTPAKPCMHTSDQPDYVYFKMIKDNSGTITYECLV